MCSSLLCFFTAIAAAIAMASADNQQPFNISSMNHQWSTMNSSFAAVWNPDHESFQDNGNTLVLTMEPNSSGARIQSKEGILYGYVSMNIKLVEGNSAGVVVAFYLSSLKADNVKDEIDFEFLGNVTNQPWVVQTNIYTSGTGQREQRFFLEFDPTESFHSYSILWNSHQIVWYIDDVPIRVYRNISGGMYPSAQPMWICTSIWNGEEWATRGGQDKINWASAPFHVSFQNSYKIDTCKWDCSGKDWWNQSPAWALDDAAEEKYKKEIEDHRIYDYCMDTSRQSKGPPPLECSTNFPSHTFQH